MSDTETSAPATPTPDPERAKQLLDACNSASAHVSVLHVAFMALCAYVLVIVFGTTDMNLLIGKGVKLPVVDVEVPIVGFYAFAPYLIVLVHFNLLLLLQLLSRKLYAFDAAAPEQEDLGGLRDQLHIFPYTYYLVGRPGPIVRRLLGAVVTITLLLLPLATLITVQLGFLKYQSEAVTWAQRVATWADVALVLALWPVIMDRNDDWWGYLRRMDRQIRARPVRAFLFGLVFVAFVLCVFTQSVRVFFLASLSATVLLVLIYLAPVAQKKWRKLRESRPENDLAFIQRGVFGLLIVLAFGSVLPLILLVDGEALETVARIRDRNDLRTWFFPGQSKQPHVKETPLTFGDWLERIQTNKVEENSSLASSLLSAQRHLNLSEQVILAKEAKPEITINLRVGNENAVKQALQQIEPIRLKNRKLKGANFSGALISGADFRDAELERADFTEAFLQGAKLTKARLNGAQFLDAQMQGANLSETELEDAHFIGTHLQSAILSNANLKGAVLSFANLQGAKMSEVKLQEANINEATLREADLYMAELQGARLSGADLRGVSLSDSKLQGADLSGANLQGADLSGANLQGADLSNAHLQGADLSWAKLQGADLRGAELYGADLGQAETSLLDVQGTSLKPLSSDELTELRKLLTKSMENGEGHRTMLVRLVRASKRGEAVPELASCLGNDKTTRAITCKTHWTTAKINEFRAALYPALVSQACKSTAVAGGIFRQIENLLDSSTEKNGGLTYRYPRLGLAQRLAEKINDPACLGLYALPRVDKDDLANLELRERKLVKCMVDSPSKHCASPKNRT